METLAEADGTWKGHDVDKWTMTKYLVNGMTGYVPQGKFQPKVEMIWIGDQGRRGLEQDGRIVLLV